MDAHADCYITMMLIVLQRRSPQQRNLTHLQGREGLPREGTLQN